MSNRLKFWCSLSLAILLINSALLWAFPLATTFNVTNLLLHVGLGATLGIVALLVARNEPRLGWTVVAAISGSVLAYMGNTRDHHSVLLIHIIVSLLAVMVLFAPRENLKFAAISGVLAGPVLLAGIADRKWIKHPENLVANTRNVPASMEEEGGGPQSPFFPSGASDLKGAEFAFKKATEAEPGYADAWLNVARALIQEGETDAAKPYIQKALQLNPSFGRIYYFRALIEKTEGHYDDALASLLRVETEYPRDRVVLNQIARILLLKREYAKAVEYCQRVCDVHTEDVQMHYTAMLCYKGLGDTEKANHEQALFQRFKADESAQAITAKRRLASPEDNNERQAVHAHESVPLP